MIKIHDIDKRNHYIDKFKINEIFQRPMESFLELFLFKKGEHICKEGDEIQYLYFFVEGKAKVYTTLSNGKSLLLCFYKDFKVLGDLELLGLDYASSNVEVIEDSYCIGISLQVTRHHLLEDAMFLRFICNSLGKKLNRCSNNSSINLLYPLESRLASYILATGGKTFNEDKIKVQLYENLTEIAELLGTSYRHLLRTLKAFNKKGILEKKGDYYEISNMKKLKELAGDLYK